MNEELRARVEYIAQLAHDMAASVRRATGGGPSLDWLQLPEAQRQEAVDEAQALVARAWHRSYPYTDSPFHTAR